MSLLQRFQSFEQGFWEHARRIVRFEEGPADLILASIAKSKHYFRHRFRPKSKERKQAIHHVKSGVGAYNAKNYDEAVEEFQYALECDPKYARALTYLGNTYYKMDRLPEAVKLWNRAVLAEPKSDAAKNAQGKLSRYGAKIHAGFKH
jgi:tetratricopeptide (TPR) repeat protein